MMPKELLFLRLRSLRSTFLSSVITALVKPVDALTLGLFLTIIIRMKYRMIFFPN